MSAPAASRIVDRRSRMLHACATPYSMSGTAPHSHHMSMCPQGPSHCTRTHTDPSPMTLATQLSHTCPPPASGATPLCSRRERGLPPHESATPEGACRHTRLAHPPRHLGGGEALAPSASNARSAARAVAMQHLTRDGRADKAHRYPPPRAGTSIGAA